MGSITTMAANGREIRLGHAFRSVPAAEDTNDLAEVLKILRGEEPLAPRPPADPEAVKAAEDLLGITDGTIYAFVGCLHPDLGTIGLIITQECLPTCLHSVSKCDSGGVAGRRGSFKYLDEENFDRILARLQCANEVWVDEFVAELGAHYDSVRGYVAGEKPRHEEWDDPRAHCIAAHLAKESERLDRRLWTWEVRLDKPPRHHDYKVLLLSHEAFKKLDDLRRTGTVVPEDVDILPGRPTPDGVHHFHENAAIEALCGGRSE